MFKSLKTLTTAIFYEGSDLGTLTGLTPVWGVARNFLGGEFQNVPHTFGQDSSRKSPQSAGEFPTVVVLSFRNCENLTITGHSGSTRPRDRLNAENVSDITHFVCRMHKML